MDSVSITSHQYRTRRYSPSLFARRTGHCQRRHETLNLSGRPTVLLVGNRALGCFMVISKFSLARGANTYRLYLPDCIYHHICCWTLDEQKWPTSKTGLLFIQAPDFFFVNCQQSSRLLAKAAITSSSSTLQWTRVELVWTSGRDISIIGLFSAVSNLISRGSGIPLPHHQWV